jgi:hypothetical protein
LTHRFAATVELSKPKEKQVSFSCLSCFLTSQLSASSASAMSVWNCTCSYPEEVAQYTGYTGAVACGIAILPFLLLVFFPNSMYANFKRFLPLILAGSVVTALSTLVLAIVEGSCNDISNWTGSDENWCRESFVASQTYFYPFFVLTLVQILGSYYFLAFCKQHNLKYGSYFLLSAPFKVLLWLVILLVVAVDCLSFILPYTVFQMLDSSAPFGWNS